MVSWPRRVLRNVTVHDSSVVILVLSPIRYTKCSTSEIGQAMKPLNSKGPILATAEKPRDRGHGSLVEILGGLTLGGVGPAEFGLD